MSDESKDLMKYYDDIDLCYKVMGLTFSDPPDKVDKVYNGLLAKYNQEMQSTDPEIRQTAKNDLNQTKELYERITCSTIYKDYAREYEKYKQLRDEEMQARKHKQEAERELMASCPYCNKSIPAKQKVCLYCHGKILSPFELLVHKVFNKKVIIVMAVLAVIAAGAVLVMNSHLIK